MVGERGGVIRLYSHYFLYLGRNAESLAESRRTLEHDPLSVDLAFHLAWHYHYMREHAGGAHVVLHVFAPRTHATSLSPSPTRGLS